MILFDKSKHFSHSTTPSTEPKSPNNEGFSADSAHAQLGGPKGLMCSHASRYSSYSYHLNFKRKIVKTFRIFFWQFKKWQKKKKFIFHNLLIKKQKCLTGSRSPLQFAPPSTLAQCQQVHQGCATTGSPDNHMHLFWSFLQTCSSISGILTHFD